MKLSNEDIKKIEQFMIDEDYPVVDFMLESFKRLKRHCQQTYESLKNLDNEGDFE